MASLAETLRKNKGLVRGPGGVLTEQTNEEIQTLTGKAGLQAPPMTPLGQAMIGASPDQQKMAGTPQQKEAALSLASQPVDQSLSGALRRGPVRTEATAQESSAIQKSTDMENLGQVGDRVTDFINTQRQILEEQAGQGVEVQAASSFQGKDLSGLKSLLQAYREQPGNQNVLLQLNQALGYDINTQLDPAQVEQLYESTVQSIARGAAGNVDDDLSVDDLVGIEGFGYDKATLSQLLGVPEAEVGKYSVGQLRDRIGQVADEEFSRTAELEQQAVSGNLGAAERGLARQGARESSRVGTRSSEADIAQLENQIASADIVSFAGKEYKIDELLKDETISSIIQEYMESAPGSDIRAAIEQQEPGLLAFIQKNQAVLADAASQMQSSAQQFRETQEYNKGLQSSAFGGVAIDNKLAEKIIPGFGKLQASRVDVNASPILKYATTALNPDQARNFANNINKEIQKDPSVADDAAAMSSQDLSEWQIESTSPTSPFAIRYVGQKDRIRAVNAANDYKAAIKLLVPDITDRDLSDFVTLGRMNPGSPLWTMLSDGKGNRGGLEDLKRNFLTANPVPRLAGGPASNPYTPPIPIVHVPEPEKYATLPPVGEPPVVEDSPEGKRHKKSLEATIANLAKGQEGWLRDLPGAALDTAPVTPELAVAKLAKKVKLRK